MTLFSWGKRLVQLVVLHAHKTGVLIPLLGIIQNTHLYSSPGNNARSFFSTSAEMLFFSTCRYLYYETLESEEITNV